jgi:hypothetical protein
MRFITTIFIAIFAKNGETYISPNYMMEKLDRIIKYLLYKCTGLKQEAPGWVSTNFCILLSLENFSNCDISNR